MPMLFNLTTRSLLLAICIISSIPLAPRYYFDAEAIKEESTADRPDIGFRNGQAYLNGNIDNSKKPCRTSGNKSHKGVTEYESSSNEEHRTKAGLLAISETAYPMRNKRSVWTVTTQPFSEAHFATFPPDLVVPCILAGTSEKGCCAACGAPMQRSVAVDYEKNRPSAGNDKRSRGEDRFCEANGTHGFRGNNLRLVSTTEGWARTCTCVAATVPCTVLDPFGGAGTTGLVADRLGRNAILIEINPDYAAMASKRIVDDAPLFAEVG
jgi:hypothetical protein